MVMQFLDIYILTQIIKKGWNLKGKIWTGLDLYSVMEMGITLKFTETNLFLIKLDLLILGLKPLRW